MALNEMQIGLDLIIGAGSGLLGAMGAYYKLKARLDLADAKNEEQERELADLRDRKKELATALHKRIDDQNHVIQDIQKEMSKGHSKLETSIAQMELRIVKEIQNMVEKLVNK
jgi:flagellar biosynthesis chaperone FliJ